jgi:hypothetical protein
MVSSVIERPNEPSVTRIHLDYEDGSFDEIRLLEGGEGPTYGLQRKSPGEEVRSLGVHTHGPIAAILFHTATTTERIEYSLGDPTIRALLARLFGRTSSEGGEESANHADAT